MIVEAVPDELRGRLDALFADFADPLYVWSCDGDSDFHLVGYNAAAERVPHANVGVLLGQSARAVYGEVLPEVVDDLLTSLQDGPLAREIDYSFVTSAARRRLLVSYTPLPPDLVVVATRDIHELWRRAESSDQRARELEQLIEMTLSLLQSEGPQEARDLFCELARTLAGADAVYLLEPKGDHLEQSAVARAAALPEHEPVRQSLRAEAKSPSCRVYESRQRLFVRDLRSEPGAPPDVWQTALASVFLEPVLDEDRVLGVVAVAWAALQNSPRRRVLALIRLLAAYAGAVIAGRDEAAGLATLAARDVLTGLPNRRAWGEELERAMAHARRTDAPLSVVVLDVDGLKDVNDRLGHAAGDELLRSAAVAWRSELRQHDVLARLGGDEFAALFADLALPEAREVVERIAAAHPDVRVSNGVATWDRRESAEELLRRADEAMYRNKRDR